MQWSSHRWLDEIYIAGWAWGMCEHYRCESFSPNYSHYWLLLLDHTHKIRRLAVYFFIYDTRNTFLEEINFNQMSVMLILFFCCWLFKIAMCRSHFKLRLTALLLSILQKCSVGLWLFQITIVHSEAYKICFVGSTPVLYDSFCFRSQ